MYTYIHFYLFFQNYESTPKTVVLPSVWYGSETWSLESKKEIGLRVFENSVLSSIFGSMME
jgi:hypothetical protein